MPPVHTTVAAVPAAPAAGASAEHQQLAHTIKHVHRTLRDNTKRLGAQRAWSQHLEDAGRLRGYASAMRSLATRFWEPNTASKAGHRTRSSTSTEHNRIAWSVRFCAEYFGGDGEDPSKSMLLQQREREHRIRTEAMSAEERGEGDDDEVGQLWTAPEKLRLLDVGSCYNPFGRYEQFDVTAVDIAPAEGSAVRQCDFLALRVDDNDDNDEADSAKTTADTAIDRLPAASFDVIVFCLLLEYLPTSEQRLHCCRTAYRLLRPEGVLIIITPDSKHVGANARLIKTWRYALAHIGLSRMRLEKLQHLTCMVFRRTPCRRVAQRWALLHREPYMAEAMHIPQDFADE